MANDRRQTGAGAGRDRKGRFLPGHGIGQATEAGRQRSLANLQDPTTLQMQHGVWGRAGILFPCDRCVCDDCPDKEKGGRCKLEAQYMIARRQELAKVPHLTEQDGPAVSLLVWTEIRLDRAARFLARTGEYLPGAASNYLELQPVAQGLPALQNTYLRLLQGLGLTPAERRKLEERGDAGAGASIAAAIRELAAGERRQGAIDGDFEAQDAEPGAGAEGG